MIAEHPVSLGQPRSGSGRSCIACQATLSFLGEKSGYVYRICDNCKTIQLSPLPAQSDVEQAYKDSLYATDTHGQIEPVSIRASSRPYYLSLARVLRDYRASGLVIDYGAGWGGLCELLIKSGFQCKGLELAGKMVDECQRRRLPVERKTLAAMAEENTKAGAIVLCGVFEHLLDPKAFLRSACDLLEEGGLFISLQPTAIFARLLAFIARAGNVRAPMPSMLWVFDPPWHVALYSVTGMKTIAGRNGFDLLEIRFAPQGRMRGIYGIAQLMLEYVNRIGWAVCKGSWPLMISHIYVFKKKVDHSN
jgi:hypothetical protein